MNGNNRGFMLINARYANSAAPVMDADIIVNQGAEAITVNIKTGFDGKTEIIPLPAGNDYTVSIVADGFVDREYYGVLVEQGILSILNVQMFPTYNYLEGV